VCAFIYILGLWIYLQRKHLRQRRQAAARQLGADFVNSSVSHGFQLQVTRLLASHFAEFTLNLPPGSFDNTRLPSSITASAAVYRERSGELQCR
jgi:hypothetical protein